MKDLKKRKEELILNQSQWEEEKPILIGEQDLQEDKKKTKERKKEQKHTLSMSKRLTLFLFINCTIIQLFTLFITYKSFDSGMGDMSGLHLLITAVVAEVVAFAIYSLKSMKQNSAGGIVYETAMLDYQNYSNESEEDLNNIDLEGDNQND